MNNRMEIITQDEEADPYSSDDDSDDEDGYVTADEEWEDIRLNERKENFENLAIDYGTFPASQLEIPAKRKPLVEALCPAPTLLSCLNSVWPYIKKGLLYFVSVTTTLPIAVYAFTYPSGINPEDITLKWWLELPIEIKIISITFTMICLGIGTWVRLERIPKLLNSVIEIFCNYCPNATKFIENNSILFMSGAAAIAALALGYYGFIWGGKFIATSFSFANLLITFGFRVESMSSLFADFHLLFDKNYHFQQTLLEEIRRIKPEYLAEFEEFLEKKISAGQSFDEAMIRKYLLRIYDKASNIDEERGDAHLVPISLFNPPSALNSLRFYIRRLTDLSLGTAIGFAYFIFHAQYGYDGMKLGCLSIINHCNLDDLPYPAKMAIATLTGISSGILAFVSGKELSHTIISSINYAKRSRTNVGKVLIVDVGSGISAIFILGAVKAMTDKANLFGIKTGSSSGIFLTSGTYTLAIAYDINSIMSHLTKNQPTHENVLHRLGKNKLSEETLNALRQHSYFRPAPNVIPRKVLHDKESIDHRLCLS